MRAKLTEVGQIDWLQCSAIETMYTDALLDDELEEMVDNRREERDAAAAAMLRRFHGNTMRNMWQVKIHVWHFMQTIVHNLHRTPKLILANAYKNERKA